MKFTTKNIWWWVALILLIVLLLIVLWTVQPWPENLTGMPRIINKGR